jgi:hypothetical protein
MVIVLLFFFFYSASELLALLTLAHSQYTMRKLSVFEWQRQSRKGEMCKMTQEVGSQNRKGRCKCEQSTNLGVLRLKIRRETISRRWLQEYVQRKRPKLWPNKWILQDSTSAHDALRGHEFLDKKHYKTPPSTLFT